MNHPAPFPMNLLNDCDREPIHIPEAIQAHGMLLVLTEDGLGILQAAGPIEEMTGCEDWLHRPLAEVLDLALAEQLQAMAHRGEEGFAGRWRAKNRLHYDVIVHYAPSGQPNVPPRMVVEVEQSSEKARLGVELIAHLDGASAALEKADTLETLCNRAANEFHRLTGFDRVMIYQFLDDDSGIVIGEALSPGAASYLHHRFPASDIPRQARALYLRNPVRAIPDARYTPQPLRPARPDEAALDMSMAGLRSVSPIHLQYLANMEVRASASVSIIIDGALWGIAACQSSVPHLLPYELRVACVTLARTLARQIDSKVEAGLDRDRLRLRKLEDSLLSNLPVSVPLQTALIERGPLLMDLLDADGMALVGPDGVVQFGHTPPSEATVELASWVELQGSRHPTFTHALSRHVPAASAWTRFASGLLAIRLGGSQPLSILWYRSELPETVRWAGNPTTAIKSGTTGALNPRASFEGWVETVRGQARRWSPAEIESASRLRDALSDIDAVNQLRSVNQHLRANLTERDLRLEQQQFLMREVNHRVQNSLTLVSSFLGLQARKLNTDSLAAHALREARYRVRAVSTVHSRLYREGGSRSVDLQAYIGELASDLADSSGQEWGLAMQLELEPIHLDSGRAVTLGLILVELVINAQKYAYDGQPGPLSIQLGKDGHLLRLTVADKGRGGHKAGKGFGSLMVRNLVSQLQGKLEYSDRSPGLAVALTAPLNPSAPAASGQ